MLYFFKDNCFYQSEEEIPEGAIELTEEELLYFDKAQAHGATLEIIDGCLKIKEAESIRQWWSDGFYRSDIHGAMPDGVIEITEEDRQSLLDLQSVGRTIMVMDGVLTTVDPETLLSEDERYNIASAQVRSKRDMLLSETDYLVMPDYPLPEGAQAAIKAYRQSLRDITEQEGFPFTVEWAEKPEI